MTDYSLEGLTWQPGKAITYSFAGAGGAFSDAMTATYQAVMTTALKDWAAIANITFMMVTDNGLSDIRIGWGKLDISNGEIGETDIQPSKANPSLFATGVTVRLEDPKFEALTTTGAPSYAGLGVTMLQVAIHELGHALGLGHSTQPTAIMNAYASAADATITKYDVAGIQALYGANPTYAAPAPTPAPTPTTPAPGASTPAASTPATATPATATPVHIPISPMTVYRFFDRTTGTQFLSADETEIDHVATNRKDLAFEGPAMRDVETNPADPNVSPVYRFFSKTDGTHFFTVDQGEANQVAATRTDLVQEAPTFSEHMTAEAGDAAVYRFFDSNHGTHFYTASATERASVIATRPDLVPEGVAFYAPSLT